VFITHFGPYTGTAAHFDHLESSLRDVGDMARRALALDASDDAKYAQFQGARSRRTSSPAGVTADDVRPLEHVGPLEFNWRGLVRYWTKKQQRSA